MRKMVAVFLVACFLHVICPEWAMASSNGDGFHLLMVDPQNPDRAVDWEVECLKVLDQDSAPVILGTGSGDDSSPLRLHRGVAVVVDRNTLTARWVAVCGNDVRSSNWVPSGKLICSQEEGASTLEWIQTSLIAHAQKTMEEHRGLAVDHQQLIQGQNEIKQLVRDHNQVIMNELNASVNKDSEVKKKRKTWPWVVAGIVVVGAGVALAGGGGGDDGPPPRQPNGPTP